MTATLFVLTALAAVGDWVVVGQRLFRLEYLLKPLTMLLLLAAAVSADLPTAKGWVVGALAFALIGDLALMVSSDEPGRIDAPFLAGVAAFLAGHVCYLVAFARTGLHGWAVLAGVLIVGGTAALALPRILLRVRRRYGDEAMAVVGTYAAAVGATAVLAIGTSIVATAIGGALFLFSDTALAWDRFVKRLPHGEGVVIVTYHLAQVLIVIGLVTRT
ncbi:MAG: lysoplasmalogenase family protein [Jatrophihabitantaceae bacterium]